MSKIICFVVLVLACLVARSELPVERNGRVLLPPAGGWSLDGGEVAETRVWRNPWGRKGVDYCYRLFVWLSSLNETY